MTADTGEIGDTIAFEASVGDDVLITAEDASGPERGTVIEKNGSAEEKGDEIEMICQQDGTDAVILYANVVKVNDMSIEYDLYAVKFAGGKTEDLGEITALRIR